jgi:hypothetical protein
MRLAKEAGVVITCATGNDNGPVLYPAAYSSLGYTLAVAATNNRDERAWFSNFGPEVDVAAPGVDIYSTYVGSGYEFFSGTSMASPHAAGVAAMLLSSNPAMTPTQVMGKIKATSEDINASSVPPYPSKDDYLGWGRINAYNAITQADAPFIVLKEFQWDDSTSDGRTWNSWNGVIEPGERIKVAITLENQGLSGSVTATLSEDSDYITVRSPQTQSYGTIVSDDTESKDFMFDAMSSIPSNFLKRNVKFTVTMAGTAGGVTKTTTQYFTLQIKPVILMVDDDLGTFNTEYYFDNALKANGYAFDIWNTESQGSPRYADLQPYRIVVWFNGLDFGFSPGDQVTLSMAELDAIMRYLESGGRLLLDSQDALYDLKGATIGEGGDVSLVPRNRGFVMSYLRVQRYSQDVEDPPGPSSSSSDEYYNVFGVEPPFTGMKWYVHNEQFNFWADKIEPIDDAFLFGGSRKSTAILRAQSVPGVPNDQNAYQAAIAHTSHFALIFAVFPFEGIDDTMPPGYNTMADLVDVCVRWLNDQVLSSDKLPPLLPTDPLGMESVQQITLQWAKNQEVDVEQGGYHVYRFVDPTANILQVLTQPPYATVGGDRAYFTDKFQSGLPGGGTYNYLVTAFDEKGNESSVGESPIVIGPIAPLPLSAGSRSSGGGGGCFIATAAYGTPMAREVAILSRFRDEHLMKTRAGRASVRLYYKFSPPIADFIRQSEFFKAVVRLELRPLIWFVEHFHDYGSN